MAGVPVKRPRGYLQQLVTGASRRDLRPDGDALMTSRQLIWHVTAGTVLEDDLLNRVPAAGCWPSRQRQARRPRLAGRPQRRRPGVPAARLAGEVAPFWAGSCRPVAAHGSQARWSPHCAAAPCRWSRASGSRASQRADNRGGSSASRWSYGSLSRSPACAASAVLSYARTRRAARASLVIQARGRRHRGGATTPPRAAAGLLARSAAWPRQPAPCSTHHLPLWARCCGGWSRRWWTRCASRGGSRR
jgi:hypothetical protein